MFASGWEASWCVETLLPFAKARVHDCPKRFDFHERVHICMEDGIVKRVVCGHGPDISTVEIDLQESHNEIRGDLSCRNSSYDDGSDTERFLQRKCVYLITDL